MNTTNKTNTGWMADGRMISSDRPYIVYGPGVGLYGRFNSICEAIQFCNDIRTSDKLAIYVAADGQWKLAA